MVVGVSRGGAPASAVLCINTGSSSVKAALVAADGSTERRDAPLAGDDDLEPTIDGLVDDLLARRDEPDVVGHRVVHGGADFSGPVFIDDDVLARLRALIPLAPLHQPRAIAAIEQLRRRLPNRPQVACFDTAFHRRLPEAAQRLPLPDRFWAAGVRRYGFHGLSYEYVVGRLGARLGSRAVVAHLGSGSSLVALYDGRPVDTTMSLTPGGGLVMATRSGDLDPGVVLHLLKLEPSRERVGAVLEQESGLAGISGTTGDMLALLDASAGDARAEEAVQAYVTSVAKHVAALVTVLGGLDVLVFTGGIGAGSPDVRTAVVNRLAPIGFALDPDANARNDLVSATSAQLTVLVVQTDEEAVIARQAREVVAQI